MSDSSRPQGPELSSGRATWLVAKREITERARDKSFAVSTAMTVVIILGIIVVPRLLGFDGTSTHRVGVVPETAGLVEGAAEAAPALGVEVEAVVFSGTAEAEAALADGDVAALVLPAASGPPEIVGDPSPPSMLAAVLQAAWRAQAQQEAAAVAGLDDAGTQALLDPAPLGQRALDGEDGGDLTGVAFIAVFVLYGQLFGYGVWVAMGIVEEKSTRVVEVLLSAIRPRQLLAGKVLGIGLLALAQLVLIAAFGLAAVVVTGAVEIPPGTYGLLGQVLLWFVLGFGFYACLFAMAGAVVSRQEEVQNAMTPLTMIILVSFFSAFAALNDPGGTIATVASFIPFSAPLTMPLRVAAGQAGALEALASVAITVAAALALIPLAGRVYQGAILRTGGRTKLADAWRGAR